MTHFPSSPADSLAASCSTSVRLCKEVFDDDYKPSKDGKWWPEDVVKGMHIKAEFFQK